jgi:uncharacterized membrane protein YcaP (DUF421 family)
MELWRIVVRALLVYVFALAIIRISGKRTVGQADLSSFVVVLVIGDMFDDMLWAEVPAAQFVVGVGALVLTHVAVGVGVFRQVDRKWRGQNGGQKA